MREGRASRDAAHRRRPSGQDLGSGPSAATVPHTPTGSVPLGGWRDPIGPLPGRVEGGPGCAKVMRSHLHAVPIPCSCPLQPRKPVAGVLGTLGPPTSHGRTPEASPGAAVLGPSGSARSRWDPAVSSSSRTGLPGGAGPGAMGGGRVLPPPGTDLQRARPSRSCQEKWANYGMNAGQGRAGMQPP